jgi:hypothetical protein
LEQLGFEDPLTEAAKPRRLRAVLLAGLGVLLLWQIGTRSLAAYLGSEAPDAALVLRPNEPTALLDLADAELNPRTDPVRDDAERSARGGVGGWSELALKAAAAKLPHKSSAPAASEPSPLSDDDKARIRQRAQTAVAQEPLNARGLRILGQLADGAGDEVRAAKLMRAAVDRSLSESVAVYWLLEKSFKANDYARAISYADIILRKRPQLMQYVAPMLAAMAEDADPKATAALTAVLAQNPPWRLSFIRALPGRISDAKTPLSLLLSLKGTDAPPTTLELRAYLDFLIRHKFYELAYYTWLQSLPADELGRIGFVTNASFESEPSGLPFDWQIAQGSGVSIDIVPRPGEAEGKALFLELGPGRADFPGVSQVLMLTPGSYRLKGKLKGDTRGRRGLQWSIRCAGSNAPPIGTGPMFVGVAGAWSDFEFAFTVPDANCRAQVLRLALAARSASEQLVSGSVWYSGLQISRAAGAAEQGHD